MIGSTALFFMTSSVIWDSYYCRCLNRLNPLRLRLIDSPPIIRGLHLDPKKNKKHASVPLHNLQILNVTIYNHYWTPTCCQSTQWINHIWEYRPRLHSWKFSVQSLSVVTSSSEHTVTSMVLKWMHIIGKERKQIQPHINIVGWPP